MAQTQTDKQNRRHGTINPIVAGAVGATVGAVAATLADPKKRAKVGKVVGQVATDLKTQSERVREVATERIGQVREQAMEARDQMEKRTASARRDAQGVARRAAKKNPRG